ncbi:MAG: transposase [Pseudomonadota bacterium]
MSYQKRVRKIYVYSNECKARAVEMSLRGDLQVKQVVEGIGIHPIMLSRWRKQYREGVIMPSKGKKVEVGKRLSDADPAELDRLQKENARLKEENGILKKWQKFLAEKRQNGSGS